jgi:hypothetical protein
MLAHYHGQIWHASEFGRSFGVADTTIRNYLDLLSTTLVVRQLMPWHENISKRQVKAPKIYITDSGLLHTLLGLRTVSDLESHPKVGASWEGFVLEQVIRQLEVTADQCFFGQHMEVQNLTFSLSKATKNLDSKSNEPAGPKSHDQSVVHYLTLNFDIWILSMLEKKRFHSTRTYEQLPYLV